MQRYTVSNVKLNTNIRCQRIYPTEDTSKKISELKTIGLKLTKEQAIHLSRVLLAVTQDWDTVEITAYRKEKRLEDNTYHITVTSTDPNKNT